MVGYDFINRLHVFITGCDETGQMIEPVLPDPEPSVELADVLIYKGNSWWIEPIRRSG